MQASIRTVFASLSAVIVLSLAAVPSAAEAWSSPIELNPSSSSFPFQFRVAASASGAAAVVWMEENITLTDLWAVDFDPSGGWSTPTLLATTSGFFEYLSVAGDDAGNFIAAWTQSDSGLFDLFAGRLAAGGVWSAPAEIDGNSTHSVFDVALAVAPDGNALAVFQVGNGTDYAVFEHPFVAGSGWAGVRLLHEGKPLFVTAVAASAVGTGDLMAAWMVPNTTYFDVRAAAYTAAGGFQSSSFVGSGVAGSEASLLIVGSRTGEATVSWMSYGGQRDWFYRSFVPASGWLDTIDYYLGSDTMFLLQLCAEDGGIVHFAAFIGTGGTFPLKTGFVTPGEFPAFDRTQIVTPYFQSTWRCFGGGKVILTWDADYGGAIHSWFQERDASGAWSSPQPSPDGPSMATAIPVGKGGALSVFFQYRGNIPSPYAAFLIPPDSVPPTLSLQAPSDGAHVVQGAVDVTGTTEASASVTVNGMAAGVSANGTFSLRVALLPGSNRVEVIARDAAGNAARTNVTVTFDDPLPAVVANLSAAEAAAAAANASASQSASDAAAARAESAALAGQVTALSAQLNATAGQATTMSSDLAAARTRLAALEQQHAALQAQVNASGGANPTAPAAFDPLVVAALLVAVIALAAAFIAPRMGKKSPP